MTTSTSRSRSRVRSLRRTAAEWPGRISESAVTTTQCDVSGKRVRTASASSTPPGPAPTMTSRTVSCARRSATASPARQEAADRLDRRDPFGGFEAAAGHAAGVDRQDVVAHRRAPAQQHAVLIGFDADHLPRDEVCAGKTRQTRDIDMQFSRLVNARDMPRQHPRIGRFDFARDDGEAQSRLGPHAEPTQHLDVAVTGTGEQDVLDGGRVLHGWKAHQRPVRRLGSDLSGIFAICPRAQDFRILQRRTLISRALPPLGTSTIACVFPIRRTPRAAASR